MKSAIFKNNFNNLVEVVTEKYSVNSDFMTNE